MPEVLPGNGIASTLSGAILVGATTLSIQTADVAMFPSSGTYRLNLHQDALNGPWEICTVTGGQGTTNLVVTRASESFRGTQTARAWPSGTHVVPVVTQASLGNPTLTTLHVTGATTLDEAPQIVGTDTSLTLLMGNITNKEVLWQWYADGGGGDPYAYLYGGQNNGVSLNLNNGNIGIGVVSFVPLAPIHLGAATLVDSTVTLSGLPHADPHVLHQVWVDPAAGFVLKQSQG